MSNTHSENDNGTEAYKWAKVGLKILCSVSSLASLFVVLSYWRFGDLRKRAFRLVFWLAVSDLGANLSVLFFDHRPWVFEDGDANWLCQLQAVGVARSVSD